MLSNTLFRRLLPFSLIGWIALSLGCQEKTSTFTPTETRTSHDISSTNPVLPKVDPATMTEDGTVLLTPPKQPTTNSKPAALDVIVDVHEIPADAKFGTPTLADPPTNPAVTNPEVTSAEVTSAEVTSRVASGEPTLADPNLGSEVSPKDNEPSDRKSVV